MIDWQYVRGLFESGQTAYQIAKRPDMPSKQGIANRAKLEGWIKPKNPDRLPIVAEALAINSYLLTDDVLTVVLGLIAEGATQEIAAQAAGISGRTWASWCKQDEKLRDAVRRARAGKLATWMSHVDTAATRDWRAAQWLLHTASETRESYGANKGDGKLEIVINIDRGNVSIDSENV